MIKSLIRKTSASAAALAASLAVAAPALAQAGGGYNRGSWCPQFFSGMGMGGGWFGWLFTIAFWVLVIAAIIWGVRLLTGRARWSRGPEGPAAPGSESALEVLKRRYAAGEIDRDQYLAMKADLEH